MTSGGRRMRATRRERDAHAQPTEEGQEGSDNIHYVKV